MSQRVLVLYANDRSDERLFSTLRSHLKILKHKQIFFEWSDVLCENINTDDLKNYSTVMVLITPTFLARSECWQGIAGYLEYEVNLQVIPVYVKACDYSATFFAKKILPGTKALSEANDKNSRAMEIASAIDKFLQTSPTRAHFAPQAAKREPIPDVALFASEKDSKLMEEFVPYLLTILPGRLIWKSWNIPAGANRAEEFKRARKAEIQIVGLSAEFLAQKHELIAQIKNDDQSHECRAFFIKLSPALYNIIFKRYEDDNLLPDKNTTITTAPNRADAWVSISEHIQKELGKKRMTANELTEAYYNK